MQFELTHFQSKISCSENYKKIIKHHKWPLPFYAFYYIMESCAPGRQAGIFSPSKEKLYPPVCSTVPTSLQARGMKGLQ